MTTPDEKESVAMRLGWFADRIEAILDPVPGWSRLAWRCPAADALETETEVEAGRLRSASETLRGVAGSLVAAAEMQRAAALD